MYQMKDKKEIRKVLKNSLNLRFQLRHNSPTQEQIEKALFIDCIKTMVEIQDRTEFMISEMGMDMIAYEDRFYRVIENLFKLHFSTEQLSLIQLYLYELKPDKSWDGTIELKLKDKVSIVQFKEPKDVWEVVNLFN